MSSFFERSPLQPYPFQVAALTLTAVILLSDTVRASCVVFY